MNKQLTVLGILLLLSSVEAASIPINGAIQAQLRRVQQERQHFGHPPIYSRKAPQEILMFSVEEVVVPTRYVATKPKQKEYALSIEQPFLQQSEAYVDRNQNYIEGPNNIVDGYDNTVIGSGNIVGESSLPFI